RDISISFAFRTESAHAASCAWGKAESGLVAATAAGDEAAGWDAIGAGAAAGAAGAGFAAGPAGFAAGAGTLTLSAGLAGAALLVATVVCGADRSWVQAICTWAPM